jgi:hypothetical protein
MHSDEFLPPVPPILLGIGRKAPRTVAGGSGGVDPRAGFRDRRLAWSERSQFKPRDGKDSLERLTTAGRRREIILPGDDFP